MSALQRIPPRVCAVRLIPALQADLRATLGLGVHAHSLGLFSADADDVAYIAADEATKQAQVEVVFGSSLYAGAAHSPSHTAGEVLLMLAGPSPSEVRAGLDAAVAAVRHGAAFQWANDAHEGAFLAHTVTRCGSYLAREAGVAEGCALAYLVAPPVEAAVGLDAALKAAQVRLARYLAPPTPTNYAAAYLSGSQADCLAACAAFERAVTEVASDPLGAWKC